MKSTVVTASQKRIYEKIIEDATMDCYDEHEQISGWASILADGIHTPCDCTIGKQNAVLEKIDTDDRDVCVIGFVRLNKTRMRVLIQDITVQGPTAMNYINAYAYWCKHG